MTRTTWRNTSGRAKRHGASRGMDVTDPYRPRGCSRPLRARVLVVFFRRHQTYVFRKRTTSVPAEGPAYGLDFARHCEFLLRALQAQKWPCSRKSLLWRRLISLALPVAALAPPGRLHGCLPCGRRCEPDAAIQVHRQDRPADLASRGVATVPEQMVLPFHFSTFNFLAFHQGISRHVVS